MAATLLAPPRESMGNDASDVPPNRAKAAKSKKGKGKATAKSNVDEDVSSKAAGGSVAGAVAGAGEETWSWSTLEGTYTNQRAPAFTKDGNYFFSIVGSSVRIYSAATGKVVSTLSSATSSGSASRESSGNGHSGDITAAILNPENPFQLLTSSLDGTIKIWDFMDAVLLQTLVVGEPISQMCAHEHCTGYVFIATPTKERPTMAKPGSGNTMIQRVSLTPAKRTARQNKPSQITRIGKTKKARALSVSSSGNWLVVVGGYSAYVIGTASLSSGFTKYDSPEKLTALATHPKEDYFATGDAIGQIRLWYCLNGQPVSNQNARSSSNKTQTTTMHWHAHAVSSLAFTPNGAYLVSGGEESVMVIWQLHSGKREFVPRVGAPIACIAVRSSISGEEEYLLGLVDGSYVFINAGTLSANHSIARVKLDSSGLLRRRSVQASVPLAIHPQTSNVILPSSHPSSLQVYCPSTSSLLLELEVSASNRVSRRDQELIEPARVESVAVSDCGEWLATIDQQASDRNFNTEVYLKIWRWAAGTWTLNSRIDRPHGSHSLSSMFFSPSQPNRSNLRLTTTGLDGTVKTWGVMSSVRKDGAIDEFWVKRSSFTFQHETPKHADISPDGSLLAIIFGSNINLHDSQSGKAIESICSSQIRSVENVYFIGRSGRFLLIKGNRDLLLWDIVRRSVKWRFRSPHILSHVLPHGSEDRIAVFSNVYGSENEQYTTRVLIFSSASPQPLEDHIVPFRLRALARYPNSSSEAFFGITMQWDIVLFGDNVKARIDSGSTAQGISKTGPHSFSQRTLFQDIFGKSALVDTTSDAEPAPVPIATKDSGKSLAVFATPSYLAPPVASLYSTLMSGLLANAPEENKKTGETDEHNADGELHMDVDIAEVEAGDAYSIRNVTPKEAESLVALFSNGEFIPSMPSNNIKPNGIVNGVNHAKPNGIRPHNSLKLINGTGLATPSISASSAPSSPRSVSPVAIGMKRKILLQE